MYVEKFKNNGTDYLRLVKSQRILNSKGVKTATKTVVYNIGPLSSSSAPIHCRKNTMTFTLKKGIRTVSVTRSFSPRS